MFVSGLKKFHSSFEKFLGTDQRGRARKAAAVLQGGRLNHNESDRDVINDRAEGFDVVAIPAISLHARMAEGAAFWGT